MAPIPYCGSSPLLSTLSDRDTVLQAIDPNNYRGKYCYFHWLVSLWRLDPDHCRSQNLGFYYELIPDPVKRDVASGKCLLVLDNSNEGHLDPSSAYFAGLLESLVDALKPQIQGIVLLDQNRCILSGHRQSDRFTLLTPYITFANYDYFLKLLINDLYSNNSSQEFAAASFKDAQCFALNKDSLFLALLGTPRPHRVAVYHHILGSPFLSNGIVSMHGFNPSRGKRQDVKACVRSLIATKIGKLIDPMLNAAAIESVVAALPPRYLDLKPDQDLNMMAASIPVDLYERSFISCICETDFDNPSISRITEKSLKGFSMGHLPLVYGSVGVYERVKELGFRTFGDLANTEYDNLNDTAERLVGFLASFDALLARAASDLQSFAQAMFEDARFNYFYARNNLHGHYCSRWEAPLIQHFRRFCDSHL